jgi:non-ribosomal peptide synthetase-like protein
LHSFFYLRKWFFDQTMALSLDVLGPIYASVYLRPWYRALGAKIGGGAEISTASFASPDLLEVGEESFVADAVSLGAPRVSDGFVTLGRLRVGKRSFIGNSAVLPAGAEIGEEVLIGCLSTPPNDRQDALKRDSTWMGSPSVFLPQRQRSTEFPDRLTFNPPLRMRLLRAGIEFVRMIAPSTGFIALISVLFSVMLLLRDSFSLWQTLALFPILYSGTALIAALITIVLKWTLVWRYRPGERPLWSTFVWRNELLNAMHEHFAGPFLVDALTGTPFICWYFRLLGARIGRRVYLETSDISEFDLASVGDESVVNSDATIQTHLFEDRVMKVSSIKLGRGCSVGTGSLVLYDSEIGDGAVLGSCSLLLKGESLPAGTRWEGIPARRA